MGNFFTFFTLALLAGALLSAETPKYDFGTMQQGGTFTAEPGETVTATLYFFQDEEYGNRITHVKVSATEVPPGWEVELNPPVHDEYVNVSGVITKSNENLYVEPKPVLPAIPADKAEGVSYLASPSGKGYLQAKKLEAKIKIPKDAELGKKYAIALVGEGFWFGGTGNVALKQSRSFRYTVTLEKKEFTEQVISKEAAQKAGQKEETAQTPPAVKAAGIDQTLIFVALAIIIVALVAYIFISRKK